MVLPEGDSGLKKHNLTADRLTAWAAWFSLPAAMRKGDIPKDIPALAKAFGVSAKAIEEARRRPELVKAVAENLHSAAVMGLPEILWTMIKKAEDGTDKECTKAARFVAEIAGVIKSGGSVNVSQTTVVPMAGEWTDDELRSKVWEIAKRAVPPNRGSDDA